MRIFGEHMNVALFLSLWAFHLQQGGYILLLVWSFVCYQDDTKTTRVVFTELVRGFFFSLLDLVEVCALPINF